MRIGELSALRWRAVDFGAQPLGRIVVAQSFDRKNKRTKSTKTGVVRENPIHPDLAHRLRAWREEGWAELAGRTPTEADLVLLNQDGGQLKDVSVLEALHGDLERLGLRRRNTHDLRATFISICLESDAAPLAIRQGTHARHGDAFDGYLRLSWKARCEAVSCLRYRPEEPSATTRNYDGREGPLTSVLTSLGEKTAQPTATTQQTAVPREGFEGVEATPEDLRGPANPVESLERTTPQAGPQGSSAEQAVTGLVTVPAAALAVLVKLARRFEDDPTIATALEAVLRGAP